MGALSKYVEKRWGAPSRSIENPITASPGAGVTKILNNNPDRFEVVIVNYDAKIMRVAPSPAVGEFYGIPLLTSGGFTVLTADDDGESVGYEWYIWSELGGTIYILETEAS